MKRPFVNVTIAVYNEERILAASIGKVVAFLESNFRYPHEIVIADNASTDCTLEIARSLQTRHDEIHVLHLDQKGRGGALKKVWKESKADILSYMDCDLSTDLAAYPPLIESLVSGGFDLAVGSRLLKPSLTTRGFKREFFSRGYNLLVTTLFNTRFSDAQCGFKAITRAAAQRLVPLIDDNGWLMDTELLILAERMSYRVFDLPVPWVEDSDSRVKIWKDATDAVKGLIRMRRDLAKGKYRRDVPDPKRTIQNNRNDRTTE